MTSGSDPQADLTIKRLVDYQPPDHLIESVGLDIQLDEQTVRIRASLQVRRNPDKLFLAPPTLWLDGQGLHLRWIRIDGWPVNSRDWHQSENGLEIFNVPERFEVSTLVEIDPGANTALAGLYRSSGLYVTQCEAEGFRRITFFPDRPDIQATFRVRISADRQDCPVLLSNGNRIEAGEEAQGRHFALWEDPVPKPSYLFALVAGDLGVIEDHFTTGDGREVALRIWAAHGLRDRCRWAMDCLKRAFAWDEQNYGRRYDLDVFNIVAVNQFNMGAMENTSLNIFNASAILADPETATDADFARIESIVAHEFLHHWTGNRVTLRDWFQLSLKEGLTVFRDQQFSADGLIGATQRIDQVDLLRRDQFAEDGGPTAHPVRPDRYQEINNFYTATVYEKGAEIIRMIHTLLGPERFRLGLALYFERFTGKAATIEDFLTALQDGSGQDLTGWLGWYTQAGTPKLGARGTYDPEQKLYRLTLSQYIPPTPGQLRKDPVPIPVRLVLRDDHGNKLPLYRSSDAHDAPRERVILLDSQQETVTFHNIHAAPHPSLLRGFSAPVRLDAGFGAGDFRFALRHEDDPFNRREAARALTGEVIDKLIDDVSHDRKPTFRGSYLHEIRQLLERTAIEDPGLLARMIEPPSRSEIALDRDPVDPHAINSACRHLEEAIARDLRVEMMAAYQLTAPTGGYVLTAREIGRRRLRGTLLRRLQSVPDEETIQLAVTQYRSADNMTERLSALIALADTESQERDDMLADFWARHGEDPVAGDKWFRVQATGDRSDTLKRVKRLMAHPGFSWGTPNRVRALIGAFSAGNPAHFHRSSGAGYRLLADAVIHLDSRNPQLAARLLSPFAAWRRFVAPYKRLMEQELRRIRETGATSPDVREMIDKLLAEPLKRLRSVGTIGGMANDVELRMGGLGH